MGCRRPQPNSIYYSLFTIHDELYAKSAAKSEFETVHLALIRLMIIAAQMQQAVQDQLRDFRFQVKPVLCGLRCGALHRNHNVAQTRFRRSFKFSALRRKRKHVGRPLAPAKAAIQIPDGAVGNEHQRRPLAPPADLFERLFGKITPPRAIHVATTLSVQTLYHYDQ